MPRGVKGSKNRAVETAKNEGVMTAVSDLDLEKVSNSLAKVQVDVAKALGSLSSKLSEQFGVLDTVKSAIDLKKEELETLRQIEVEASTLDEIKAQIAELRSTWEQQVVAERERRTKELSDYEYNRDLSRKREEDRYNDELAARQREWEEKERDLADRQQELENLRAQVAAFDDVLKKAVAKAEAIVGSSMKKDFETQNRIAEAERNAERKLLEQQIASEKAANEDLKRQLTDLNNKYTKALEDNKAISTTALQSFGGRETVQTLQRVMETSQAPTQPRK